jgi:ABC-type branched-subunit amino acid transport system substrate-binding protein
MPTKDLLRAVVRLTIILIIGALCFMVISGGLTRAAEPKMLKVGFSLPLNNLLGIETKKCLELLIPELNKTGLVVKGQKYIIEPIIYDDKYTTEGGRAVAERLVHKDKVKYIATMIGSAPTVAALSVTEPNKVLLLSGCMNPKIVDPANKYAVRPGSCDTSAYPLFMWAVKNNPGIKTCAAFSSDTVTGKARIVAEEKNARAWGLDWIGTFFYPPEETDFAPLASKVARENPDLLVHAGNLKAAQWGLGLKALYEAGYRGWHSAGVGSDMAEVFPITGQKPLDRLSCNLDDTSLASPPPKEVVKLRRAYEAKYGVWNPTAVPWLSPWFFFVEAIKKADSIDVDDILAVLNSGLEAETAQGRGRMIRRPDKGNNKTVDGMFTCYVAVVKDGKYVYRDEVGIDEGITAFEKVFGVKVR